MTGTRKHGAVVVSKTFYASSPYLFKACCKGQKLNKAIITGYKIDDSGEEVPYYQHLPEGVKVNSYSPGMANVKQPASEKSPHMETVALCYEKITHTVLDGNISYSDSWTEGR